MIQKAQRTHVCRRGPSSWSSVGAVARFAFGCAIVLWHTWVTASPAAAHATVVLSSPAENAVIDGRSQLFELQFNEEIDSESASFALDPIDGSGSFPATIDTQLSVGSRLVGRVGPLPDGPFVLTWTATGEDGHEVSNQILYEVKASGVAPPAQSSDVASLSPVGADSTSIDDRLAADADTSGMVDIDAAPSTPITDVDGGPAEQSSPLQQSLELKRVVPGGVVPELSTLARFLWLTGVSLFIGGAWLVTRTGSTGGRGHEDDRWFRMCRSTLLIGCASAGSGALLRILVSLPVRPTAPNPLHSILATAYGRGALASFCLTLVSGWVVLGERFRSVRGTRGIGLATFLLCVGVTVDVASWGHASSQGPVWILGLTAHIVILGLWAGPLAVFAYWFATTDSQTQTDSYQRVMRQFYIFAQIAPKAFAIVVATGCAAVSRTTRGRIFDVFGSDYGSTLLFKVAVLIVLVSPLAWHHRGVLCQIREDGLSGSRERRIGGHSGFALGRSLGVEAFALAAITLAGALLVGLSPADKQSGRAVTRSIQFQESNEGNK